MVAGNGIEARSTTGGKIAHRGEEGVIPSRASCCRSSSDGRQILVVKSINSAASKGGVFGGMGGGGGLNIVLVGLPPAPKGWDGFRGGVRATMEVMLV